MSEMSDFDKGLSKMGNGIRRAHAAFDEADAGFLEALEALKVITLTRGSLDGRLTEMRETIARLETLVIAQGDELRVLRDFVRNLPPPA